MGDTYGLKITARREGSDGGFYVMREFEASSRGAAVTMARGWLVVEGYDADRSGIDVVADGMTFAAHMKQELVNMAARMSLRHGVSMEGPFVWKDGNGDPGVTVRLWVPNGRGVSVSSQMEDGNPVRSQYAAIREDESDPHGWSFDHTVQAYSERTTVGDGFDGDVSELLTRIAVLPRK